MRITLADKLDQGIACRLANFLELPLISLTESDASSSKPESDDGNINQICEKILNCSPEIKKKGFFLYNYPQNVIQAQSLDMALGRIGQPVSSALMLESTKTAQNRAKLALIRYYRSQNKLILIDKSSNIEKIGKMINSIYAKRRINKTG